MSARNGKSPPRKQKPSKTTALAKRPQPHGGALNAGGTPGNRGGPGRPAEIVKARARNSFYVRIPVLEKVADDPRSKPRDRINAVDKLGKYGLAQARELVITTDNARAFFDCISAAIREIVPDHVEAIHLRAQRLLEDTRR